MIPHSRKYHFITVHYGSEAPTRKLIEHLTHLPNGPDTIIVVDHAETPFRAAFAPHVVTIRPSRNSGYAGGVNTGIGILAARSASPHDIIIAANNDLTLAPDAFSRIRRWWEQHSTPAIAGAQVRSLNVFTGRSRSEKTLAVPPWRISYLDGVLLTAPLQVFAHFQGLPNHLFLYWEDVLLSLRARQAGVSLTLIPGLQIVHHSRKSEAASDNQLYYLVRNGADILARSLPFPWRWWWRLLNPLRRLYHALHPKTPTRQTIRAALHDAAIHRTGPRP